MTTKSQRAEQQEKIRADRQAFFKDELIYGGGFDEMSPKNLEQLLIKMRTECIEIYIRNITGHCVTLKIIKKGRWAKIIQIAENDGYQFELSDGPVGLLALSKTWLSAGSYIGGISDGWGGRYIERSILPVKKSGQLQAFLDQGQPERGCVCCDKQLYYVGCECIFYTDSNGGE